MIKKIHKKEMWKYIKWTLYSQIHLEAGVEVHDRVQESIQIIQRIFARMDS